jgi:hypothetical protein
VALKSCERATSAERRDGPYIPAGKVMSLVA